MKKMIKSITSKILVISLVFNMTGVCYAQENQSGTEFVKNGLDECEMQEIVEKIETLEPQNDYKESVCSAEEIEDYIDTAAGIECAEIEEEKVSVEEAVEGVFNADEISECDIAESKITEYEETKYITEIYEENDTTYVKTYSEDMLQMSIVAYNGEQINSDSYIYNTESGEFEKQHMELVCEDVEDESIDDVYAQAVSYSSKTKSAKWKGATYWYRTGNNGKKTYLKIGCKASYRIRTDNLSSSKDKRCDAYISAVKSSRSYEKKALAYAAAAGVSGTTIIALVLANATFPPSTIVTIVFGVLGGGATIYNAITHTVDSFEKWQDARDYYNRIKSYGRKLK